jgi:hypothetical protein
VRGSPRICSVAEREQVLDFLLLWTCLDNLRPLQTSTATTMASEDRVRLHITPFTPDLFDRVVSTSAKATATGISYHSVQTQPERGFGYIELPRMEADKLKKKIHGFVLKGSKVRVEEAKPEKKRKADRDETEEERKERKKAKKEKKEKKEKKAKKEDGVIPGYELEDGRHVKRGWSEGKDKKKSKEQKMLFKTSIPPNAMPLEDDKKSKSKEKKAKREEAKDGERKSRKTPKVVEEFAKKKHMIISTESDVKAAAEYVEGKGWVDENGDIIEAEPPSVKRQRAKDRALQQAEESRRAEEERRQAEAMDVDVEEEPAEIVAEEPSDNEDAVEDDVDSASAPSDDDDSEDEEMADDTLVPTGVEAENKTPAPAADIETPVPETTREVHPLEALYKRAPNTATDDAAKHNLAPINTSFSFFNPEDAEDDEDEVVSVPAQQPQTPHTKQDLEWRALRSAGPTPDTAGLGKRFRFAMDGAERNDDEDSDDDSDEEMSNNATAAVGGARDAADGEAKEESEFRKWFYEHRGENNRAWKKKRKEAKKQQRQRENRRLSRKVV